MSVIAGDAKRVTERTERSAQFCLCSIVSDISLLRLSSMSTQHTHNPTSSGNENLSYAMQSTMEHLREQVERVCATNEKTEKRCQSLMGHINEINVSLMSSYVCVSFHNKLTTYIGCHSRTKGT
jgi:hypothetical protein